jgi:hypothetical protein
MRHFASLAAMFIVGQEDILANTLLEGFPITRSCKRVIVILATPCSPPCRNITPSVKLGETVKRTSGAQHTDVPAPDRTQRRNAALQLQISIPGTAVSIGQ